ADGIVDGDITTDQRGRSMETDEFFERGGAVVPMVLLTATLPPTKEGEVWRRMNFLKEEVRLFRARTRRRNIRYGLKDVSGYEAEEKEAAVVRSVQAKL